MELDETDVRNAWNRRKSGVEFASARSHRTTASLGALGTQRPSLDNPTCDA
jgi:hypothetical protein